jgi:hypothetical protein
MTFVINKVFDFINIYKEWQDSPPILATRWHIVLKLSFTTFIWQLDMKLVLIQQPLRLERKKHTFKSVKLFPIFYIYFPRFEEIFFIQQIYP